MSGAGLALGAVAALAAAGLFQSRGNRNEVATETLAFRRWFGNSRVVDSVGRPKIVYHGATDLRGLVTEGFRPSFLRGSTYFAVDRVDMANSYTDPFRATGDYQEVEPGVLPLYLSIQNPKILDAEGRVWRETEAAVEAARAAGHDGLIVLHSEDWYHAPPKGKGKKRSSPYPNTGTVYVWFHPSQAKSAATEPLLSRTDRKPILGSGPNRGTWSPTDARLSFNRTREGSRNPDERLDALIRIVNTFQDEDLGKLFVWHRIDAALRAARFADVGSGGSRMVVALDAKRVAKIEYDLDPSANRAEMEAWEMWKRMGQAHQLVPALGLYANDRILVMERALPLRKKDARELEDARRELAWPREEAAFDFNWGRHEGAVKLLDYVS